MSSTDIPKFVILEPRRKQMCSTETLTTATKLDVILLSESQQGFWSQSLWNTNDKNGYYCTLTIEA